MATSIINYENNAGISYKVRATGESTSLEIGTVTNTGSGTAPTDTSIFPLNVSHRRREPWSARYFSLKFSAGLPPGRTANSILKIPVFQLSLFNSTGKGSAGNIVIEGSSYAVIVTGKTNERGF
jgi:hypothetical protein